MSSSSRENADPVQANQPAPNEIAALRDRYKAGDLAAAKRIARTLTDRFPDHPIAWKTLGVIATRVGRLQDALVPMQHAVRLAPNDAEAHSNLASLLNDLGRFEQAEQSGREAVRLAPVLAEAHNNLGNALKGSGRLRDALDSYDEALRLKPDDAQTHYNKSLALKQVGLLVEAETSSREAIRLAPNFAQAHNNLGVMFADAGHLQEALSHYREALCYDPNYAAAHSNLGNVYRDFGRLSEAEHAYRRAIGLEPDFAEAFNNLGAALSALGRPEEARDCWREAIQLKPDYAQAHSNLLLGMCYQETASNKETLEEAQRFGAQVSARALPKLASRHRARATRKLRVGFVSADLRDHPVATFLEGVIAHLDRNRFEPVAFPTSPKADHVTQRLAPLFVSWIPIHAADDNTAAARIHAERIDVLFDLSGHTSENRLSIFAYKPAPVQVTWLGYPGTTGVPEMDFRLVDAITDPAPTFDGFASERLVRLEGCFLCYTPPRSAPPPLARSRNSEPVFGSANNIQKVGPATLALWAELLAAVPDAKLALKSHRMFEDAEAVSSVVAKFAALGIARERLVFHGGAPSSAAHLAFYNGFDVALDPLAYNGTTTTCEALWMGVPVVTLAGDRHAARVGASLLTAAGMPDLIAADPADYVAKAVALAADRTGLEVRRKAQRPHLAASPLLDAPRFADKFAASVESIAAKI